MKHVHNLSQAGETITNMVASDHYETLYMDINKGNGNEIVAYNNGQRRVVTNNPHDLIFGDRSGTLYLGQVQDKHLVKVLSAVESSDTSTSLDFKTEWEGSIPFDDNDQVIIGAHNQVIVYDNSTANIIANGKLEQVTLQGEENYITSDGAELVQLTHQGDSTLAELKPFK